MSAKTASKLDTLIDSVNVPSIPTGATVTDVPTDAAPSKSKSKSKSDQKNGRAAASKGTLHTLTVDGFELTFATGTPNADALKASVARATSNPWYAVAEWLAAQVPGFLTIRKIEGSDAKSPMSRIDSAIARARKQGVKNYGKLDAKSGTEKGVWFFIRRP